MDLGGGRGNGWVGKRVRKYGGTGGTYWEEWVARRKQGWGRVEEVEVQGLGIRGREIEGDRGGKRQAVMVPLPRWTGD